MEENKYDTQVIEINKQINEEEDVKNPENSTKLIEKLNNLQEKYAKLESDMAPLLQQQKNTVTKSLTLIDIEDFIPFLPLDGKDYAIDEDDNFVEHQYQKFMDITSGKYFIDYREHKKLKKFISIILKDHEPYSKNKNKVQRNFLYNLIYHKYQFDIEQIQSQNVFINYYFDPKENGTIKQLFVASVQVLFTILLLIEIVFTFDIELLLPDENKLNFALAAIVTYLVCVLIKPSISSIVKDIQILEQYFILSKFNTMLNITANIALALLLPWITFFVILASESMTDVVLNATAIAFIIELDDDAANEIDLENWFVTAGQLYDGLFREIIQINNLPKNNYKSIQETLNNVKKKLRDNNTKIEYNDFTFKGKFKHFLTDFIQFLFLPLVMFRYPYDIIKELCNCKPSYDMNEEDIIPDDVLKDYNDGDSFENDDDPDDKTTQLIKKNKPVQYGSSTYHNPVLKSLPNVNKMEKAMKYNNEGNEFVNNYQFSEAYKKYEEAIKECPNSAILYYNKGFALYKRGKQSWISETITNKNGHTYKNYTDAIESFNDYKDRIENDGNVNTKRHQEIEEKMNECESGKSYLKILYDFRLKIYQTDDTDEKQIDCDVSINSLETIVNDANDKLFNNDKLLKGKYYYVISDYYSQQKQDLLAKENYDETLLNEYVEKEKENAIKAYESDKIYGLRYLNVLTSEKNNTDMNSNAVNEVCNGIIEEYTKQIELNQNEPYYYYIRGRAYYELSKNEELEKKEELNYLNKALHDFTAAKDLDKTNRLFWMRVSVCQSDLHQNDEAELSYKSAMNVEDLYGDLFFVQLTNTRLGLFSAFVAAELRDDQPGCSGGEWKRFLARLDKKTRKEFKKLVPDFKEYTRFHGDVMDLEMFEILVNELVGGAQGDLLLYENSEQKRKYIDENIVNDNRDKYIRIILSINATMVQHGRDILLNMQEAIEFQDDGNEGLTKEEWNMIISMIPKSVRKLFNFIPEKYPFEKYANDNGIMHIDSFMKFVDELTLETKNNFTGKYGKL